MSGFADLLFLIEEAKTVKNKLKNKLPPPKPKISHRSMLSSFSQHIISNHLSILHKINSKYSSTVSKTTLVNGDIKYDDKSKRYYLFINIKNVGEVKIIFDSRFNLVDIER